MQNLVDTCEPPRGKTHTVVSEQVRHKSGCTVTEAGWKLRIYVACPKSPVTHTFYSERIAGTKNSYSCRIIDHTGTYFTVQNDTHFNDLTATVTLVTISRHGRSKSNYAKCFRNFYFSQSAKSTKVKKSTKA